MSYTTWYSLTTEPEAPEVIKELREENEDAKCALEEDGNGNDWITWYDATYHIKAYSKKHPDIHFIMHEEGEDACQCKDYIRDGKMQVCNGRMVFEEFLDEAL